VDSVTTSLPNLELGLKAAPGQWVDLDFVDAESGDPVGERLVVRLDFGEEDGSAYERTVAQDRRVSRVRFLWPHRAGVPGRVRCTASIPFFQEIDTSLDEPGSSARIVVKMQRVATQNGVLRVRNPWPRLESVWHPNFRLYCNASLVGADRPDPSVSASLAEDAWVFADVPPGQCTVKCNDLDFAFAVVGSGQTVTVDPILDQISHLILRPRFQGERLRGTVRVTLRGWGIGMQLSEVSVTEEGELHVIPALKGKAILGISQGEFVSDPAKLTIDVPGRGEIVVMDVEMRKR
jgi:hypothetical protein